MPANVDALVQEGITALRAGNREDARRALTKAVELNDQNEQAWLWLSGVVETLEDRRICLENVLELNPGNPKATKGLQATLQEIQQQPPQQPASAPPKSQAVAPFPDPFGGAFDVGAPFATSLGAAPRKDTSFDVNPYTNAHQDDLALNGSIGGWTGFDADATDWGVEEKPAPSSSSRDVSQPSEAEYDNWMAGLSIGGSSTNTNSVPAFDTADFDPTSGPFGSSSTFSDDSSVNPFETSIADPFNGQEANPFDTMGSTSAFGNYTFDDDSDDARSAFNIPVSKPSRQDALYHNTHEETALDDNDDQPASGSDFDFGAEPPVLNAKSSISSANAKAALSGKKLPTIQSASHSVFDGVSMLEEDAPPSRGTAVFTTIDSSPSMDNPAYFFKLIPAEIQADSGSSTRSTRIQLDPLLLGSLIVLVVLNLGSLLFLLTNLGR